MKPLGTGSYLKSNVKKIFPQFICVLLSVCFVYLISVIFYSSIYGTKAFGTNLLTDAIIVKNEDKDGIPKSVMDRIKNDSNVEKIIPLAGDVGNFQYTSILTPSDGNTFSVFKEDVKAIVSLFHMKLIKGRLPKGNSNEIIIPFSFAKQNKINIGDYLGNDEKLNTYFDDDYRVVGIMDGPCSFMVTSKRIKMTRNEALKHEFIISVKSTKQDEVSRRFRNIADKNIIFYNYNSMKKQFDESYKNVNIIKIVLSGLITFVLCISIMHINYVALLNRKKEFFILNLIGYKKTEIYKKILKENAAINLLAFGIGIIAAMITTEILNITLWEPKGEYAVIFNLDYVFTAFLVPVCVFVVNTIVSLRMNLPRSNNALSR